MREHCECDVTVTAMLLVRWLVATGIVKGERLALDRQIADAAAEACPYRPRLMAAIKASPGRRLQPPPDL